MGKTTVVLFLALLLAKQGKRVLAIDADPQANLTFYLGCEVSKTDPTLLEVLTTACLPEDAIYSTRYDNLFLIPADRSLFKVSDYLSSSGAGAFILKVRLQSVKDLFDICLIDVQPTRSQICLTAVGATDSVIIPAEATTKGVNSLIETQTFLREQREVTAFTGQVVGVLPFRDRWAGRNQTIESRENIEAMREIAHPVPVLPSILEAEPIKRSIRTCKLPADLGYPDLQYPFEQAIKVISHD